MDASQPLIASAPAIHRASDIRNYNKLHVVHNTAEGKGDNNNRATTTKMKMKIGSHGTTVLAYSDRQRGTNRLTRGLAGTSRANETG
ncbi:MAG TPA: hypothetical protein VNH84_18725 [Candidatus Saccharimonadales bacterium]|nr:hypothetical protein [Candidatus Saccharimonadales bacterium]